MKHVATEQPQSREAYRFPERDSFEPEIKFESSTLPEIVEMPKFSELPTWIRRPIEHIKRLRSATHQPHRP
jgi:hypothetical protein